MSNILDGLKYSKTHEWVSDDDGLISLGLTDFAQEELGDIVFVNLPEEGDSIVAGEAFADVESVKAVSDVYSPVTGVVAQINEELLDNPALINEAPYDAWFVKVSDVEDSEDLLTAGEYADFCKSEKE
ncbi:MAG: glycine cleavage system protein GcvH [Clostridia bacterium]|nr:glycine cleavage system protein GcvH [Clostridia bacterium]